MVRSLSLLEPSLGIRIVGVSPGFTATPLLLNDPVKSAYVGPDERDILVKPEAVAQTMLRLVIDSQYAGGTILEVTTNDDRRVEAFNDPGPDLDHIGLNRTLFAQRTEHILSVLSQDDLGRDGSGQSVKSADTKG
jgi:hypothetical protein